MKIVLPLLDFRAGSLAGTQRAAALGRWSLGICVVLLAGTARGEGFVVGPYLQDVRGDGALVSFETSAAVAGEVTVETAEGNKRFESPVGVRHEVRVTGLKSGRYAYRVAAGGAIAGADLATAATGEALTFLVYGDNRDRNEDHARVVAAMTREAVDFVLHTGDMTGDAGDEALWPRFFAIEAPLLRRVAIYPTAGNHEYLHDPRAEHYHHYFAVPPSAWGEAQARATPFYSFRIGRSMFVALDGTQSRDAAQAAWLERTLSRSGVDASIQHVFVFFHQPPFSVTDFCGSAAEQGLWVPEFKHHGVRAVFAGHAHAYEHMERDGVRYFVSGGGGAPLVSQTQDCPEYDKQALRMFRAVHHFLRVRIIGEQAVLDAVGVDGELLETVRLHEPAAVVPLKPAKVPYLDEAVHPDPDGTAKVKGVASAAARRTVNVAMGLGALLLLGGIAVSLIWKGLAHPHGRARPK